MSSWNSVLSWVEHEKNYNLSPDERYIVCAARWSLPAEDPNHLYVNQKPDHDDCFKTIKLISSLIARKFLKDTETNVITNGLPVKIGLFVLFMSCFSCFCVCSLLPCGHLLGKGWPLSLGSRLCCLIVFLSLSHVVSWVRCGTWLYWFLIFAAFHTFTRTF